jgi:hypothetical protein
VVSGVAVRTTVFPSTWTGCAGVVARYAMPPDKTETAAIRRMTAGHASRRSFGTFGTDFSADETASGFDRSAASARDSASICSALSSSSTVSSHSASVNPPVLPSSCFVIAHANKGHIRLPRIDSLF